MAENAVEMAVEKEIVATDVLIVGGGVSGLWLLNQLKQAGYSAYLVEHNLLGGEQTNHSHLYLHRGHAYIKSQLAIPLRDTCEKWDDWIMSRGSRDDPHAHIGGPSLFGFESIADAEAHAAMWSEKSVQLGAEPRTDLPEALRSAGEQNSAISVVYETRAECVTGEWLIRELLRDVAECVGKIDYVETIERGPGGSVGAVTVRVPDGRVTFDTRMLVLAAGFRNQLLISELIDEKLCLRSDGQPLQMIRWGHMLVIRGSRDQLPPLSGIFHPSDLFLVSRVDGDETVWLVSDWVSPPTYLVTKQLVNDERTWFPAVWEKLQALAPGVFSRPESFRWGVYSAPKAEAQPEGTGYPEERAANGWVDQCGVPNLAAVWPTKLTLAPRVSDEVLELTRRLIREPRRDARAWQSLTTPEIARERWRSTGLVDWDNFRHRHLR